VEPQPPQFCGSVARFTQPISPPQFRSPAGQPQTPAVHRAPGTQALLQLPQLVVLVCSFTQPMPAPQYVCPAGHAHAPPVQLDPGPQTIPHPPQFGLVVLLTHMPVQAISPDGHAVQTPLEHIWPVAHRCAHVPQLFGSVAVLTHIPGEVELRPQVTSPPGHA